MQLPSSSLPVRFIGHEIYRGSSYGPWHPLRVPRVSTVMDLTRALGWLPTAQFIISPRAKPAALSLFHTPSYIAALAQAEADQQVSDPVRDRHNIGTPSNPVFAEMFRRPATSAGASLLAGELLSEPGIIYSPAGGTHHGFPDYANGFCYFNDPVLAILSLRRSGLRRIAYIDIDAHHPDGVEARFADDAEVLQISTHEENRWPRTGALADRGVGQVYNLPLPREMNDDEMALIRDHLLLPLVQRFRPEAIVLQCGSDALLEDPQSCLSLSNNAHLDILRGLMPLCDRLVVLGGGGYNPWSVGRLWSAVWGVLNGHELPDSLPDAARGVLADLRWEGRKRFTGPPAHWVNELRDAPRNGPIRADVRERVAHLATREGIWH